MSKIDEIKLILEEGSADLIPILVREALKEGIAAKDILKEMIDSMGVVGDKFSAGEIFIPEMLMSAKAMSNGVDVLKTHLTGNGAHNLGTCIIGTVAGDLHDIGKNLVAMMIESAGFTVVDLGVDVHIDKWSEAIKEHQNVTLVACSALLTTTMPAMRDAVRTIKNSGLSGFKVIVGGASVTQKFANEIGADGYSEDAGGAAVEAVELVSSM